MFLLYIYVTEEQFTAHFINCGQVSQADLKLFFESICGEVYRLRVLGDCQHSTRIAFVEFVMAESATAALNCSGVVLGSMPLRIKPLKDSSCARVHLSVPCALIFESSRRWLTAATHTDI
ncbi:polyadenylate-binding protein-interacting protein 11-like isoform X1 [Musa acuminata AAA Group]|uniref:polyadenylate-binding protein-interacting protein 11-like isoform X1 n=1 Tax=Musa acuminata AAA Group TaxID=214697 RepID=UPI0031D021D0